MDQQLDAPRTFTIVVGLDYSEASTLALQQAVRFAETHQRSGIHVVHSIPIMVPLAHGLGTPAPMLAAIPPGAVVPERMSAELTSSMKSAVEKAITGLGEDGSAKHSGIRWTMHLRQGPPAHAIVQLATDLQADLAVVGTHARGWLAHFLLGSVAEAVVRQAPCPVLVARPPGATAAEAGPQIEPPCPDCVSTRAATEGTVLWCERHREHHGRAHTYHFTPFRDSHQSGELLHPLK